MRAFTVPFALAAAVAASAQTLNSAASVVSGAAGGATSATGATPVSRTDTIGLFGGTATAQADYGTLRASAFGFVGGAAPFSYVQGQARFTDRLTITGGTGTGFYLMDYTVSGDITGTGDGSSQANLLWNNLPNGAPGGLTPGTGTTVAGVFPVELTYGVAFDIYGELFATVTYPSGGTGSRDVDFSTTATLSRITVLDAAGNVVSGLSVGSASGHVYPTPVPEPATLAALGLGLAFLRRRR